MKKLMLFAFAVFAFAACTQDDVEELSVNRTDVPETLTVCFEGADDDTRIQLNEAQKTVWNAGDEVSVFYKSYDNLKFQFQGKTGDRSGTLKMVDGEVGAQTMGHVVVVYPYSTSYRVSDGYSDIEAILPATQTYLNGSYGEGGNIMVATSEFTSFTLKNVCGWLRVDLTGDGEKVQSITLRGNNEEQLAGLVYINADSAEITFPGEVGGYDDVENSVGGCLMFEDSIFTKITLNCGEGVELGAEAKSFYIGLLPQAFEKGVAVEILCDGYKPMTLTTTSELVIERNHIKPMESVAFEAQEIIPYNEIRYTATAKVEANSNYPWTFDTFGANILSHDFNEESGEGVITFDTDVTTIGDYAFCVCYSLTSITIPDSVTTIGEGAFYQCDSLTSVTIGDSVTTIVGGAFYWCTSLTSVTIGNSVTTIGGSAFYYCDSLTSVTIPDSVTTIGEAAFCGCGSLTEFNGKFASEDGRCLIVDGTLNSFAPAGLTSYTIPDSVTTIGDFAFAYCYSLTSITIGDSVTTIGDYAFYSCSSLTSVTIPDSVTTIGNYAFFVCDSLTSVYCEATLPPSLEGSSVFYNNASERKIYVPEESVRQYKFAEGWSEYADYIIGYDFESGVVVEPEVSINNVIHYTATAKVEANSNYPWTFDTFGANILSHDFNEESGEGVITFDTDVTTIGEAAFRNCNNLTSVTIVDSVTTIGEWAFYSCASLTSITIPDSVTTIGERAFYFCSSLTSVTIGDSVTTIGDAAFAYCSNLTSITIPDSVTTIGDGAFGGCDSLTSITIPDSVTTIGDSAFGDCDSLTSVTIPDSVTTIGDAAFQYCSSLTSVTIPNSVTTIGDDAFRECDSLTSVTIPDSVTTMGEDAFYSCDSLTSAIIGDSVTTIGGYAFYSCYSLTSVTIGDSVTTIGECAFRNCSSLTSVTIPDSVTTMGNEAFCACSSLTSVTIGDSVTTIGEWAFYNCSSLTSVTIGDSVTTIGQEAFAYCSSLTSVTIPDSVTTIGQEAFAYCDSITSVYCEATTPPSLGGNYVFDNIISGRTIYVPTTSVEAYKTADYWIKYARYIVGYDFENGVVVE